MSLAGLDPSGGAGLLADIKTFEAHGLTGFGVCTALTVQTDDELHAVEWLSAAKIIAQAAPLLKKFPVQYCKIGIVGGPDAIQEIVPALQAIRPGLQFVLDPVLKASAGFPFHTGSLTQWEQVLPHLLLLTPNYGEAMAMMNDAYGENAARKMAVHCAVLLKGGHRPGKEGWDTLYHGGRHMDFEPPVQDAATEAPAGPVTPRGTQTIYPKHGSGCVLSAAITAALANGFSLEQACREGKAYTFGYLQSAPSLLGHHRFNMRLPA